MSLPPTVTNIRAWSKIPYDRLGYSEDDDLQVLVDRAVEYVQNVTGRTLATLEVALAQTGEEATQRRVEQLAYQSQPTYVATGADDLIQTLSAGSFSETKRDSKSTVDSRLVNPWPILHDLLWRLMTADMRAYWQGILEPGNEPATEITEIDWAEDHWYSGNAWGA